jgi:hypothetical protein
MAASDTIRIVLGDEDGYVSSAEGVDDYDARTAVGLNVDKSLQP